MRYLSLLVIPLALALVGAVRRPGRHERRAAPDPAPARSSRVRPYAPPIPSTEPPPPYDVPPQSSPVRPYVLHTAHCARRRAAQRAYAQARADASWRGLAVLMDLADPVAMWHCQAPGCQMSAPYPVAHPCPLTGAAAERRPMAGVAR